MTAQILPSPRMVRAPGPGRSAPAEKRARRVVSGSYQTAAAPGNHRTGEVAPVYPGTNQRPRASQASLPSGGGLGRAGPRNEIPEGGVGVLRMFSHALTVAALLLVACVYAPAAVILLAEAMEAWL